MYMYILHVSDRSERRKRVPYDSFQELRIPGREAEDVSFPGLVYSCLAVAQRKSGEILAGYS
jgi:hypothetical protein